MASEAAKRETSRGKAGLKPEREGQKPILLRVKTLKGEGNLSPREEEAVKRFRRRRKEKALKREACILRKGVTWQRVVSKSEIK
jgi:hypothetical protein